MTEALEDHEGTVSIGGRVITNLRFADDIDGLTGSAKELEDLVHCLNQASTRFGMEISAEKTKLMRRNTEDLGDDIEINGQRLETVTAFKYLGSIVTDEGQNQKFWPGLHKQWLRFQNLNQSGRTGPYHSTPR